MVAERIFLLIGVDNNLSLAELSSVLQLDGIEVEILENEGRISVFSTTGPKSRISILSCLDRLGWSFKVGHSSYSAPSGNYSLEKLRPMMASVDYPEPILEKSRWGVSMFSAARSVDLSLLPKAKELVSDYLKEIGVKKTRFVAPDVVSESSRELSAASINRNNLLESGFEVLIVNVGGKVHLGLTDWVVNTAAYKERDLSRPNQRVEYSIPPRLARAMLNLAAVKKGDVILDPFCGFGTILQEGLMLGLRSIGRDIDKGCVLATQNNLSWLRKIARTELPRDSVMVGDATHLGPDIPKESVDAIVTEPILIPPLLRRPSSKKAKAMLREAEGLYISAMGKMADKLRFGGRMVLTTPSIVTSQRDRAGLDLDGAFKTAGLRRCKFLEGSLANPLPVFTRKEVKVNREIHVLQRM